MMGDVGGPAANNFFGSGFWKQLAGYITMQCYCSPINLQVFLYCIAMYLNELELVTYEFILCLYYIQPQMLFSEQVMNPRTPMNRGRQQDLMLKESGYNQEWHRICLFLLYANNAVSRTERCRLIPFGETFTQWLQICCFQQVEYSSLVCNQSLSSILESTPISYSGFVPLSSFGQGDNR